MVWLIYGYREKETQIVKYVGQTSNEKCRRYKHEIYDPTHKEAKEYNYPLSRGIRKHGLDFYEYFIIEDKITDEKEAIEREAYWISYYNTYNQGYNQTAGGKAPKYIKFSSETIELTKLLLKQNKSFNEISNITGISLPHISEINTGKRHHDGNEIYPLTSMTCGRKLTSNDISEIIKLLETTKLSQKKIGDKFNVAQTVISHINLGKSYRQPGLTYPIRHK